MSIPRSNSPDGDKDSDDDEICDGGDEGFCEICAVKYYGSEKHHRRMVHQDMTTLKFKDSRYTIYRTPAGTFDCPSCNFKNQNPQSVQRHARPLMQKHFDQSTRGPPRPIRRSRSPPPHDPSNDTHGPPHDPNDPPHNPNNPPHDPQNELPREQDPPHDPPREPIAQGDITDDDEELRSINAVRNERYNILICRKCEHAIDPSHAYSHFHKHGFTQSTDFFATIVQRYSFQPLKDIIPPQEPYPAYVQGLSLERNGSMCSICLWACASSDYARHHPSTAHSGMGAIMLEASVQSIVNGPKKYFRVLGAPNLPTLATPDVFLAYMNQLPKAARDPAPSNAELNPFIAQQKWQPHVTGLPANKLIALAKLPRREELYLANLRPTLELYVKDIQGRIKSADSLFLQRLNSVGPSLDSDSYGVLYNEKSFENYMRLFAPFLSMVLRSIEEPLDCYPVPLSQTQLSAAKALLDALKADKDPSDVVTLLHNLSFQLLCTSSIEVGIDSFLCPLKRFIIISNLKHDGGFEEPVAITPKLAPLKWFTRATLMMEIIALAEASDKDVWKPLVKLEDLVHIGQPTPFGRLSQIMSHAFSAARQCRQLPRVVWEPNQNEVLHFDGEPISIPKLGSEMRDLANDVRTQMESKLFFNLKLPKIDKSKIVDPLTETKDGFSFLTSEHNQFALHPHALFHAISNDPILSARFLHPGRKPNGDLNWNILACREYLADAADITEKLMVLLHMSCGQPARGGELASFKIINTPHRLRNIFWLFNQICIISGCNKTTSVTGQDKLIPRFPPEIVSDLLLEFLAFSRPFQLVLAHQVAEPSTLPYFHTHLFVDWKKKWLPRHCAKAIHDWTLPAIGVGLGLRTQRHVYTAIYNKHRLEFHDDQLGDVDDAADDLQAGHSSETAHHNYALDKDVLGNLTPDALLTFLRVSMKIHVLLGFEPAFGEAVPGPDESSLPRPSSSLNTLSFSNGQLLVALEKLLDQKLPPLLATCLPRPKVAQSSSNAAVSYDRRDALKLYTGDPNASFNSLEQAISLDTALKRDENALIIIPTGGGKSVVFMIPPLYYESEVTVVVLPLVALTHDMVRRAQDINLPTCCWAYNNVDPSSRLVFISVEQAGSDAFLVWGVKLAEDGKLARIAVDECHNALTALDYRPCMANLSKLRSLKVQILLLSATVPPVMEERLLEALNIQNVRIIRAATNRAEIRYIIHRTPESQLSKQISHTIADLSDRLLKTPRDRGICFSTSIHHCEELAAAYSELSYHGQAPSDQRESVVQLWRSGNAPIIKATSAFGEGVDYGPIRFVINCCAPKNAVEFVQQSGRCARDGQLAEAHLFLSPPNDHDVPMSEPRSDLFGQKVISELETSSECIRTILSRFMDGKTVSCGSLPKAELCSNCEKMQNSMFPPATARVHRRSASEDSALVAMFEKRKKLDPDAASRVSAPKPLARLTRPMASIQPAQSALLHPDAPPPRNQHPGPAILMDHAYHTVNQRQRGEKEAQLSRALNIIQDYCSICWIVTRQLESHQQCPNVDLSGYAEVQHRLVFILRQVCWHCFLPLGIELHPDNIARAEDCRFRNVVGPAVYAIWKIIPLRAQMEAHFNCAGEIDGWEQFAMWLSRRERTYSNLIEVFIWASSLQL